MPDTVKTLLEDFAGNVDRIAEVEDEIRRQSNRIAQVLVDNNIVINDTTIGSLALLIAQAHTLAQVAYEAEQKGKEE